MATDTSFNIFTGAGAEGGSAVGAAQGLKESAIDAVNRAFDQFQTSANLSSERLGEAYEWGVHTERQIYDAAQLDINRMRQQRAADAQSLAQSIGVPVPISEFTDPVDITAGQYPFLAAGGKLLALQQAQTGLAEVEAFTGKVLPMMRTESVKQLSQFYDAQIVGLKARQAELQAQAAEATAQRQHEAQLAMLDAQLDKIQSDRDFILAKESIKQDNKRIAIERMGLAIRVGELTGEFQGKPTLAFQQIMAQLGLDTRRLDLTELEIAESARQFDASQQLDWASLGQQDRHFWAQFDQNERATLLQTQQAAVDKKAIMAERAGKLLISAITPGVQTISEPRPVRPGESGAFQAGDQWYKYFNRKVSTGTITDWTKLYNFLRGQGIPKNIAIQAIRAHYGAVNWSPRKK